MNKFFSEKVLLHYSKSSITITSLFKSDVTPTFSLSALLVKRSSLDEVEATKLYRRSKLQSQSRISHQKFV